MFQRAPGDALVEIAGCHYVNAHRAYFLVFDEQGGWAVEACVDRGRWWVTPASTVPPRVYGKLVRQGLKSRSPFVWSIIGIPAPMGTLMREAHMGRDTVAAVRAALVASGRKVW